MSARTAAPTPPATIGIIGAGRYGTALARTALRAGLVVLMASSRDPVTLGARLSLQAPGASVVTAAEAARRGDVVVLAVPLRRIRELSPAVFAGRVVIDATNHLPVWDGPPPDLGTATTTSEWVQEHLVGARVVKTLNHLGADELEDDAAGTGSTVRRALAVAGDDDGAVAAAMALVERRGFDAVDAGPLAAGAALEPTSHAFNGWYDRERLFALLTAPGAGPGRERAGPRPAGS